jgi:mannitol-1-phosphate/altronate dehydrogenase
MTRLGLNVAAWMRYVTGIDERGQAIDVHDPLTARFKAITTSSVPTRRSSFRRSYRCTESSATISASIRVSSMP